MDKFQELWSICFNLSDKVRTLELENKSLREDLEALLGRLENLETNSVKGQNLHLDEFGRIWNTGGYYQDEDGSWKKKG